MNLKLFTERTKLAPPTITDMALIENNVLTS
jgi:hypothetical protein